MEGLANAELRGRTLTILAAGKEKPAWRRALVTLIRGFRLSTIRNTVEHGTGE